MILWVFFVPFVTFFRLDMVGKLETMEQDVEYIRQKFPSFNAAIDTTKEAINTSSSRKKDVSRYLKQLTKETQEELCQMYQMDFEMFDYNCDFEAIGHSSQRSSQ